MKFARTNVQSSMTGALRIGRWILTGDLLATTLAFVTAVFLRYGIHWDSSAYRSAYPLLPFLAVSYVLWFVLFYRMRLDGFHGGWWPPSIASGLFLAVLIEMSFLLAGAYLTRQYVSRMVLISYGVLLFPGFLLVRQSVRRVLRGRHASGEVCRVVIAGSDHVAQEIASKITHHPEMLCRVVGFLFPQDHVDNDIVMIGNPIGWRDVSTLEVTDLLELNQIHELIVALPQPASAELVRLANQCQQRGIGVSLVPQPYDLYLSRLKFFDLDGLPILKLCSASFPPMYLKIKRALDLSLGGLLFVLSWFILLPSALILRLIKGKAFEQDIRCGKNFKQFTMLRLNVSRNACLGTGFERVLDRFSVTELPQLWNVLKGDMSLVGPRPEPLSRTRRYTSWEEQRLRVKPGMTGLAQVRGLRDRHSSEAKSRLDLQYLLNPSLLTDFSILLQTVWTLAIRPSPAGMDDKRFSRERTPPTSITQVALEVNPNADRAQSGAD